MPHTQLVPHPSKETVTVQKKPKMQEPTTEKISPSLKQLQTPNHKGKIPEQQQRRGHKLTSIQREQMAPTQEAPKRQAPKEQQAPGQ